MHRSFVGKEETLYVSCRAIQKVFFFSGAVTGEIGRVDRWPSCLHQSNRTHRIKSRRLADGFATKRSRAALNTFQFPRVFTGCTRSNLHYNFVCFSTFLLPGDVSCVRPTCCKDATRRVFSRDPFPNPSSLEKIKERVL